MRKTYERIWQFIPRASHIRSNSRLSTKTKGRTNTSLTYKSDKDNTGRQYANNIKKG